MTSSTGKLYQIFCEEIKVLPIILGNREARKKVNKLYNKVAT